jgi:hypothetical protein
MRAKILEGMAVGKVVLSTRLGMEGIDARDQSECLLADTPEDWLQAVRWCMAQGSDLVHLGHNARVFCDRHFDNLEVARRLIETFQQVGEEATASAR